MIRLTKVAFVDQTGQLGGAELSLLDIVRQRPASDGVILFEEGPFADRLREASVDVQVCAQPTSVSTIRKDAGFTTWFRSGGQILAQTRRLSRALRPYDVVYANTAKAFFFSALANIGSHRKLVYHLRDLLTDEHFSTGNRRLLVMLANRCASRVIANSQATATAFVDAGGDLNRSTVVYNGIDPTPYQSNPASQDQFRNQLRDELGVHDAPLVAIFGRLADWKGQHVAIEAISRIPAAHLLVVGDALFGEAEYRQQLNELVSSSDVSERVHFLGFRNDVPALMQAADIVAHCSTSPEPFGRVIVEGMLSRRAVVASNAGGVREILEHEATGLLCEPGSVDDLTSAINRLIDDVAFRARIASAGQAVAERNFSLDACVSQVNAAINSLTFPLEHAAGVERMQSSP